MTYGIPRVSTLKSHIFIIPFLFMVMLACMMFTPTPARAGSVDYKATMTSNNVPDQADIDAALAMQEIVDVTSVHGTDKDWTKSKGMLGLGTFGSFIASVILFILIAAFGIGVPYHKKKYDIWWIPFNKTHIFTLGKGCSALFKSFAGIPPLVSFNDRSDRDLAKLSYAVLKVAINKAQERMESEGWVAKNHIAEQRDCDKHTKRCVSYVGEVLETVPNAKGKGVPFWRFAYVRDSDGARHEVVAVRDNNDKLWIWEGYGDPKYREPKTLSVKELKSNFANVQ